MNHPLERFHYCPVCGSKHFAVNDFKSKRCEDCGFVYYANASAANAAFIENERGELLVVRRKADPAKGTLDLPGGFTDMMETGEEGVVREVWEETGLHVEKVEYLFSLPNVYHYSGIDIPTLDMFFRCKVSDKASTKAGDDAEAAYWLPANEIRPDAFGLQSIRKGIERYLVKKE